MIDLHKILGFVPGLRKPVLSVNAETLLENFFVAAVASVLTIRLNLHIAGYPKIAGAELHIAHVLFGGLLMLIALIFLLAFLNHTAKVLASVIGGIGFGVFIDELGKFVTRDNDYFYQPTIALIYVAFVLLYLLIRIVVSREGLSSAERFANAFEIAKQASITGLAPEERRLALEMLEEHTGDDIIAQNLRTILLQMSPASSRRSPLLTRSKKLVSRFYKYAVTKWWFTSAIVGFFTFVSVTSLSTLLAVVEWSWGLTLWFGGATLSLAALFWSRQTRVRYLNILASAAIVVVAILLIWAILGSLKQTPLSLIDWAQFVFPGISGVIVVIGLLLIPLSRLRAYKMFRLSVLISIFFTQVLAFYEHQFLALVGLLTNAVILLALRYMINHAEVRHKNVLQERGLL